MSYQVLSCGSNGNYQLGQSHDQDLFQLKPSVFKLDDSSTTQLLGSRPVKVACGGNHTGILLENGHLYTTGLNNKYQLFKKNESEKVHAKVFEKVDFGDTKFNVKDVVAGWEFTVIVTTKDQIYVAGYGASGELGKGKMFHDCSVTGDRFLKLDIPNSSGIRKIKCSIHSTIVQFNNGELWCWGNNKKGQLIDINDNKRLKLLWDPVKITEFEGSEVVDFGLGRDFTVFVVKDHDGILQLKFKGKDNFNISSELEKVKLNESSEYLTMWSSIHFVDSSSITSIGNGSHGQLFPSNDNQLNKQSVKTGSEHGLILMEENQVYAWGWGEHGNCGIQSHKDRSQEDVTFNYLNPLYKPQVTTKVLDLFGGCATSWVITQITTTDST